MTRIGSNAISTIYVCSYNKGKLLQLNTKEPGEMFNTANSTISVCH